MYRTVVDWPQWNYIVSYLICCSSCSGSYLHRFVLYIFILQFRVCIPVFLYFVATKPATTTALSNISSTQSSLLHERKLETNAVIKSSSSSLDMKSKCLEFAELNGRSLVLEFGPDAEGGVWVVRFYIAIKLILVQCHEYNCVWT